MSTTDAETARNREQFDRLADSYDVGQARRLEDDRLRRLVGEAAGKVLDVACGTGAASDAVRPIADEITGLDASPAMLAKATARLGAFPFEAVVGSSHALPFSSDRFDTVVCSRALHHMTNPTDTINEMVRVSKAGGVVVITDNVVDEPTNVRDQFDVLERLRDPSHARILPTEQITDALRAAGCRLDAVEHALQVRPLDEWLTDAGTDDVAAAQIRRGIDDLKRSGDAPTTEAAERKFQVDDGALVIQSRIVWVRAVVLPR